MTAIAAPSALLALMAATLRAAAAWHDRRCCHFANTTDQEQP